MNNELSSSMTIKDLIIRQLAARIANDALQHATTQAQLELLTMEKESEIKNGQQSNGTINEAKTKTNSNEAVT